MILEEINASGCNSGACHAQMYIMGTILRHGSDEQKQRYLPKIASGELRLQAFGVTEPTAGSDTTRIQTTAERVDGGYVVRGQKIWTSRAQHSDLMLLLARTTPLDEVEKRTEGLSTFIVDMQQALAAGTMTIRPIRTMMNHATTEIFLDGVEVPADALVGEEGKGFRYILDGMNAERILIAAECIGDGRWFVEKAAAYASERVVFGRPIGQNQGVQFPIARAHAAIEAADLMRYKAAWLFEQGQPCGAEANTGEAARLRGVVGGGERLPRHARRLRLRRGVRHRAQVPRDAPVHGRAGLEQPDPGLPRASTCSGCRARTDARTRASTPAPTAKRTSRTPRPPGRRSKRSSPTSSATVSETFPVTGVYFREVQQESSRVPHNAPYPLFIVGLRGRSRSRSRDGEVREFPPGSVVLVEDTTGKGHTTRRVGEEPRATLMAPLDR